MPIYQTDNFSLLQNKSKNFIDIFKPSVPNVFSHDSVIFISVIKL